jgi:hypothetical protein
MGAITMTKWKEDRKNEIIRLIKKGTPIASIMDRTSASERLIKYYLLKLVKEITNESV